MIDQAVPGSAVTVPAGVYDIDAVNAPLKLRSGITLDLRDGVILRAIPNAALFSLMIQVVGVDHVTILGGILEGDRYTHLAPTDPGAGGGGALLGIGEGAREIMVIGTRLQRSFCDGVLIRDGGHIELNGVICDYNRRQGVTIANAETIYIHDGQFSNSGGTPPGDGIDIENDLGTETVANVLITRNVFFGNEGSPVGVGGPGQYTNINIRGNQGA